MSLAGIKPLAPGFKRCEIRPQLADLEAFDLDTWTPPGPIVLEAKGRLGDRWMRIVLPAGCAGELIARREEELELELLRGPAPEGWVRYGLPSVANESRAKISGWSCGAIPALLRAAASPEVWGHDQLIARPPQTRPRPFTDC